MRRIPILIKSVLALDERQADAFATSSAHDHLDRPGYMVGNPSIAESCGRKPLIRRNMNVSLASI